MTFTAPTLASETVVWVGSFPIRNTMLVAWLAMTVLTVIGLFVRRTGYTMVPGRFQSAVELVVEKLYNFFHTITQNERETRQFFPFLATIFLFLIVGNWLGILPGVGSILIAAPGEGGHEEMIPLFRSMNADVNMTLVMAVIAMLAVQVHGIKAHGFLHYSSKFFIPPWRDPIGTFVGLLEFMGEFTKIISFTFRLFGNIFAGEVLLVVISFLVPYLAPAPFLALEMFVGFIQALVFAVLTSVFLKMAVTSHGDAHAEAPA